jgi:transcription elongation factor Elf1
MGCYNTITVNCPVCGTESYFQTKSGDCSLSTFTLEEAPAEDVTDVNRHSPNTCEKCGATFDVAFDVVVTNRRARLINVNASSPPISLPLNLNL